MVGSAQRVLYFSFLAASPRVLRIAKRIEDNLMGERDGLKVQSGSAAAGKAASAVASG